MQKLKVRFKKNKKKFQKFQKKMKTKSIRKRISKKKIGSDPTWPGPNLAWPGSAPTNLPETKTFQFCKHLLLENFCTNISLINRGKVFPYKKIKIG